MPRVVARRFSLWLAKPDFDYHRGTEVSISAIAELPRAN
jgi:hypothetical protein